MRNKRVEKGLSLRDVARLADRHHSVFGKIETERKLDIVEFVEYCKVLDVDPHQGLDIIITSLDKKPFGK